MGHFTIIQKNLYIRQVVLNKYANKLGFAKSKTEISLLWNKFYKRIPFLGER